MHFSPHRQATILVKSSPKTKGLREEGSAGPRALYEPSRLVTSARDTRLDASCGALDGKSNLATLG